MNSTFPARLLAVAGSAALVGVLAGTAAATAADQGTSRSTTGGGAGCAAVSATATVQPGALEMGFGRTHHTAR